jgi:hypothetical protein
MELELESNSDDIDQTKYQHALHSDQDWPGTGTGSHKYAINLTNMQKICKKICLICIKYARKYARK